MRLTQSSDEWSKDSELVKPCAGEHVLISYLYGILYQNSALSNNRCCSSSISWGAFTYGVRCFWVIFDLPTYPNQILYYISLSSKIRCSLTYVPTYLKIWCHMWMLPNTKVKTCSFGCFVVDTISLNEIYMDIKDMCLELEDLETINAWCNKINLLLFMVRFLLYQTLLFRCIVHSYFRDHSLCIS